MGMLATVINALAFQSALGARRRGHARPDRHQDGAACRTVHQAPRDPPPRKGRVVILAGGTGNPYFTTDTAAALRAIEIEADVRHEGHEGRRRLRRRPGEGPEGEAIRLASQLHRRPQQAACASWTRPRFRLCMENHLPIVVFKSDEGGQPAKVVRGERRRAPIVLSEEAAMLEGSCHEDRRTHEERRSRMLQQSSAASARGRRARRSSTPSR